MKILIIPDSHLKSWMFERAHDIMKEKNITQAIQLGDNLDDFYAITQDYKNHNAMMVWFNAIHPNTIWLYGNHEVSYLIGKPVTGNIDDGREYALKYQENFNPKAAVLIDNVIFSHAGITDDFVDSRFQLRHLKDNPLKLVEEINNMSLPELWTDSGPLWSRHQIYGDLLYDNPLIKKQVCGHTPLEKVRDVDNCITTDVFSTDWGKKHGEEKFIIIDTKTGEWEYAN